MFRADFWAYAAQLAVNAGIARANGNCTGASCKVSLYSNKYCNLL
jgi:hypothetical protein